MADLRTLNLRRVQLVVVDVQEKLLPHINEHEDMLARVVCMVRAAHELEIPTLVSEQYPQGLGRTPESVMVAAKGAPRLEKMTFSCWRDEGMHDHLLRANRSQVLLVGIESHVCVQKTALDLLEASIEPVVLADAVSSRNPTDKDFALRRMERAGVLVTTVESAIFEMIERSDSPEFKKILPIVK